MGRFIFCLACVFGGAFMFGIGITLLDMVVQGPTAWAWNLALTLFSLAGLAIAFLPILITKLEKY